MKKLLGITILSFFWSGIALSEFLGSDKTVDYYLDKEEYNLHSTNFSNEGIHIYHLISRASKGPDIITCLYTISNEQTYCFAP